VSERALHQLQAATAGVASLRAIQFAGEWYRLRRPSLVPLLAYLAAATPRRDPAEAMVLSPEQAAAENSAQGRALLAAMHQLLQAAVTRSDWPRFQEAAITLKADRDDIDEVVAAVIEEHTAWKYWPAVRLLGFLAANLEERDGDLIRGGRSLADLTPRQACNWAYAVLLGSQHTDEDRDRFLEDLFWDGNPEADALAKVAEMTRARQEAASG
jgi:hypothetical protein